MEVRPQMSNKIGSKIKSRDVVFGKAAEQEGLSVDVQPPAYQ